MRVGYSSSWLGLACVGYGWVLRVCLGRVWLGLARVWLGLAGSPTRNCRLGDSPGWPALAPAVVADHHLLDQAILVLKVSVSNRQNERLILQKCSLTSEPMELAGSSAVETPPQVETPVETLSLVETPGYLHFSPGFNSKPLLLTHLILGGQLVFNSLSASRWNFFDQ